MKRSILFVCLAVLLSHSAFAQDALDLAPSSAQVGVGETFELEIDAGFASAVLGGEFGVDYDARVLELAAIDWNPGYGDDPQLRCPPQLGVFGARGCAGDPGFMAMGQLAGLPDGKVASLVFRAVAQGSTTVELSPGSPFSDLAGGSLPVSLGRSVVTVPEPGLAISLLLGGLGLGVAARRRPDPRPARAARRAA